MPDKFQLRPLKFLLLTIALASSALAWSLIFARPQVKSFATWESLELDTHAAVWLIEKHVEPGTVVKFLPSGADLTDYQAIAIPGTSLGRGQGLSAYEKLLAFYGIDDENALKLARIVNAIEVSSWSSFADPQADIIEQTYRWLQKRLDHNVTSECYRAYFDLASDHLSKGTLDLLPIKVAHLTEQNPDCEVLDSTATTVQKVRLMPIEDVLASISVGDQVIFIDVRERSEYQEGHIPGALNLTLRDIDKSTVTELKDADVVITYCIKDFRGYEAARKLASLGLSQVGTMQPHGLAGWHSNSLPVTSVDLSDAKALSALHSLIRSN